MDSNGFASFADLPKQLVPPYEGSTQVGSKSVDPDGFGELEIVENKGRRATYEDVSSDSDKDQPQQKDLKRKTVTEDTDSEDHMAKNSKAQKKKTTRPSNSDSEDRDVGQGPNTLVEKKKKGKTEPMVRLFSSGSDDEGQATDEAGLPEKKTKKKNKKSTVTNPWSSEDDEIFADTQVRNKKKNANRFLDTDSDDDKVSESKKKKIMAFKPKLNYETDSSNDEQTARQNKKAITGREFFQGEPPAKGSKVSKKLYPVFGGDYGKEYLEAVKSSEFSPSHSEFFDIEDPLVTCFGIVSHFRGRLGYCHFGNTFKIYIRKHNPKFSPSILGFHFSDILEISAYLKKVLAKIKKQTDEGKLPDSGQRGGKKLPSQSEFWAEPDVFISGSGESRIRIVWDKNMYHFHFNIIVDSPNHPNYFGPKMKLVIKEVAQLLECFDGIRLKCPSAQKMMTMD